jgi:carbon-monoxide dehydrogenase medium subunit
MSFDAAPHSAYQKYHHPASHYAMVGVAVVLELEAGAIASARVGVTGVGEHAYRAGGVEKALVGVRPSDQSAVAAACAGAAAGVEVRSDTEASATYRAAMTDVFTARAVLAAAER